MSDRPIHTVHIGETTQTPLGLIHVAVWEDRLIGVSIGRTLTQFRRELVDWVGDATVTDSETATRPFLDALQQYIAGDRRSFELPIEWRVLTEFQADVLRLVHMIPYGETRTYGDIATTLNKPNASRAVGRANATNPMPIIIPCHRVIGSRGNLRGYNAPNGIAVKAWLLKLEGSLPPRQMSLLDLS